MIFILITMLPMIENHQKSIFLLLFTVIYTSLTYIHKPFILSRLNEMELKSNYATLITNFAGCLYVFSVNDFLKAVAFLSILLFNLGFLLLWLATVINIYIMVYAKKIQRYCPRFINFLAILQKTMNSTEFTLNFRKYAKSLLKNFQKTSQNYSLNNL